MCGRFSQTKTKQEVKKRFNLKKVPETIKPLFNIAPSQDIEVIFNESPEELSFARWGLLPSWSKEEKTQYSMINARAETITEKPTYKRLIRSKRCLVIADSFFEWKKASIQKIPYRIMMKDEGLFAFAGIWDQWEKEGVVIKSCSIITTAPNKLVADIHDRMPVIIPQEKEQEWLKADNLESVLGLLKAYSESSMTAYQISPLVNSPSNNTEEVIKAV